MTQWLDADEQRAWRGLLQMTAQLEQQVGRQLQEAGLSKADYDVLVPLSEAPGGRLRVMELARGLSWEQSRLSHHLARMQRRELVDRQECPSDRRGAFVVLTAAGRAALEAAAPAHAQQVRRLVFDVLGPEHVAALTDISERVLARLADGAQQAPVPGAPASPAARGR